ncbi:MAG: hypothetical protein MI861_03355, partial [Pirellulales bacterium]|nr:hypothetical protein [Pirellulales bacterium]
GPGSELYRGLGAVITGGLAVSTVFTVFLVPVVLSMVFDLGKRTAASRLKDESSSDALAVQPIRFRLSDGLAGIANGKMQATDFLKSANDAGKKMQEAADHN